MITRIASCWDSGTQRTRPAFGSAEADRPIRKVVELAAARIDLCKASDVSSVVDKMEANGIFRAWQLQYCNASHWAQYGASHGLETAIRHELQNPTETASGAGPEWFQPSAEKLRQFLLIPGPDGLEPKPLGDANAPLLTLLTVPCSDRQKLVIVLCELLALVAGLLLSVPLQLLRLHSYKISSSWTSLPSTDDWFDVCVALLIVCQVGCIIGSCFMAVFVSASGFKGSVQWYGAAIDVLGLIFNMGIFGSLLPVLPIIFWHIFRTATSPYPMMGVSLLTWLIFNRVITANWKFHIHAMALEIYHLPSFMRSFVVVAFVPNLRAQLSTKALRPLAIKRAAMLKASMGEMSDYKRSVAFTFRESEGSDSESSQPS